jgi:hypothetical protein
MMGEEPTDEVTYNWIVGGSENKELHGYSQSDTDLEPSIIVKTSADGYWTFKFKNIQGTGRIQVSKGSDYNPLDLIETFHDHIIHNARGAPQNPINLDNMDEWQKMMAEDYE